jgi:hypothetical protein
MKKKKILFGGVRLRRVLTRLFRSRAARLAGTLAPPVADDESTQINPPLPKNKPKANRSKSKMKSPIDLGCEETALTALAGVPAARNF